MSMHRPAYDHIRPVMGSQRLARRVIANNIAKTTIDMERERHSIIPALLAGAVCLIAWAGLIYLLLELIEPLPV